MKKLLLIPLLALLVSCATLNPEAERFVVRVEQSQSAAYATFDFILNLDQANRPFWRTNAPAFHRFCEYLRTPVPYGDFVMSRCVVAQLNVDDLKVAYKKSRTVGNSNALYSAWSVLSELVVQTYSWSNIISAPIHP